MDKNFLRFVVGVVLLAVGIYGLAFDGSGYIKSIGFIIWGAGSIFQALLTKSGNKEILGIIISVTGALLVALDFFYRG